jgi:TolB-like protein
MDRNQPSQTAPGGDDRLESWKEIAAYLKRDVRTLHRWEASEGLPVHRHAHAERGSVYAYKSELEAWRRNRKFAGQSAEQVSSAAAPRPRQRVLTYAALGLAILSAVAAAAYFAKNQALSARRPGGRAILVVLPFENLSHQPEEDYLSDGLTDELITELGGLDPQQLGVIARTSALHYKGIDKSAAQVGKELGVNYVVEGTVRREGNRVLVAVKLVQASDETNLWAGRYERDVRDISQFDDDVARDLARNIQIQLKPRGQAALAARRPANPQAYEAYLRGLYFWNKFTNPDLHKSVEYFQEAIAQDPNYAPAYAGLGAAYVQLIEFGESPADLYPKSEVAARKAIELDDTLGQAYETLTWSLIHYHYDWAAAEQAYRRALELNPSNSYAHASYAKYLAALGRFDQAREEAERARQIDPASLPIYVVTAQVLFYQKRYDEAFQRLAKAEEMDRNFPPTYWTLAHVYEATGRQDEACRSMLKAFDVGSGHVPWFAELDGIRLHQGWRKAWQEWVRGMLDPQSGGFVQPYTLVEAYVNLERDDEALAWLQKAADAHDIEIVFLKVDPRFDRLRKNPRFGQIVESLNFPR